MKHILFTLKGCPFDLLDDKEFIRMVMYRATKECKSTLLNLAVHKFDPQGVTSIAMLAESHISIHTCLLYTSPSPRDQRGSRMPSSA